MKKILVLASLQIVALSVSALQAGGLGSSTTVDIDALIQVLTCTGANANCPQTGRIGAGEEKVVIDFNAIPAQDRTDLGQISGDVTRQLALPTVVGAMKGYAFKPALSRQVHYFVAKKIDPSGTAAEGLEVVQLYRQLRGAGKDKWIYEGQLRGSVAPKTWGFQFSPDGKILTRSKGKLIDFDPVVAEKTAAAA